MVNGSLPRASMTILGVAAALALGVGPAGAAPGLLSMSRLDPPGGEIAAAGGPQLGIERSAAQAAGSGLARYPALRRGLDLPLSVAAAGTFLASLLIGTDVDTVPPEGLDPSDIPLDVDSDIVGNRNEDADLASDWTVAASLAFPLVLGLASSGERFEGFLSRGLVYAEALAFKEGLTSLGKRGFSRARPFAYLPEHERPADSAYDVTADRAFRSMPSGHSSGAWTAVSLGITEHLLMRPDASSPERIAVGVLGGILAGSTSALRVHGGQHFPSDVVVGAVLGVATGVTVPLLHRGADPLPSARPWLEAAAGTLAGAAIGALLASTI